MPRRVSSHSGVSIPGLAFLSRALLSLRATAQTEGGTVRLATDRTSGEGSRQEAARQKAAAAARRWPPRNREDAIQR